jgi:hypothetical protein
MADRVDHTHGDAGAKPADGLDFQNKDFPDPEEFDWFWNQVPTAINDHADTIETIDTNEDGVVDEAETAHNTIAYKGNDIDSDGDGKVDSADVADSAKTYKDNDIDSDGDGTVDSADVADTASGLTGVSHSELSDAPTDAHHSEQHTSDQHSGDTLHNDAVGFPSYQSLADVPSIPEGHVVYVKDENDLYVEDGT